MGSFLKRVAELFGETERYVSDSLYSLGWEEHQIASFLQSEFVTAYKEAIEEMPDDAFAARARFWAKAEVVRANQDPVLVRTDRVAQCFEGHSFNLESRLGRDTLPGVVNIDYVLKTLEAPIHTSDRFRLEADTVAAKIKALVTPVDEPKRAFNLEDLFEAHPGLRAEVREVVRKHLLAKVEAELEMHGL